MRTAAARGLLRGGTARANFEPEVRVDYEKLGLFYLGTRMDRPEPFLYDARDLLTHAVIVGMTGSGKTGLGITLLEEAAIDGIPALVIDPKGDLADLALRLDPRDPAAYRPWVDPDAARRAGLDVDAFAAHEAGRCLAGLGASAQPPERLARWIAAGDVAIYTPGSTSVRPLSVLSSFACPSPEVVADADQLRGAVATAASSLLSLLGIDADPVSSREHVLLSTLIDRAWRSGRDTDLAALVGAVHAPAIDKIGALPLDTFFPPAERQKLAIKLNALVASPAFQPWLEGDPIDVAAMLYADGKPRITILSIAHLSDPERMFIVTLVLGRLIAWMRAQPGTSSLRALLYMDEIAGYAPPVANPPSKAALLTLLKQARAYGLGAVLATQNPVDLDYKGLSNAGTWFVGRLQTERDKLRLLDGLEQIGVDRAAVDARLSALAPRQFVVHDVHAAGEGLVEITTRFALSYLRGPLTLAELGRLAPPPPRTRAEPAPVDTSAALPAVAALPQLFVPALSARPAYAPGLLGIVRVHVSDAKLALDHTDDRAWLLPLDPRDLTLDWAKAAPSTLDPEALDREPAEGATFAEVPAKVAAAKTLTSLTRSLSEHAARTVRFELTRSAELGIVSRPGESEAQLRARLADRAREARDARIDALRAKHATRLRTLEERITRANAAVGEQQAQATARKVDAAVSFGATVLGALFHTRGSTLSRASTAARGVSRVVKESSDVDRAERTLAGLEDDRDDLVRQIEDDVAKIAAESDATAATYDLEALIVKPKKGDLEVRLLALVWSERA